MTHEKPRKLAVELVEKTEELTKKHGFKVLEVSSVHNDQQECMHETYSLYDALVWKPMSNYRQSHHL